MFYYQKQIVYGTKIKCRRNRNEVKFESRQNGSRQFCRELSCETGGKMGIPQDIYIKIEPPHDKTNEMAYAPSEDSDQPEHLPSLISLRCALNG